MHFSSYGEKNMYEGKNKALSEFWQIKPYIETIRIKKPKNRLDWLKRKTLSPKPKRSDEKRWNT